MKVSCGFYDDFGFIHKSSFSTKNTKMLLTGVAVVAREHQTLYACPDLCLTIEQFVDGPKRWLYIPQKPLTARRIIWMQSRHPFAASQVRVKPTRAELDMNEILATAAKRGLLHVLQWLYTQPSARECEVSSQVWEGAVKNGHLHVLDWLYELHSSSCSQTIMKLAVDVGRPDVVQWMLERFPRNWCDPSLICNVLCQGTNFRQGRRMLSFNSMSPSIRAGRVEVVKVIHECHLEFSWTPYVMDSAARGGYLGIIKFLHENRSEGCTTGAMDDAAAFGHLDIVKYLHENRDEGCTTTAMDMAAARGYFEVVQFLHENRSEGCSIDALDEAVASRHLEVAKWLAANRSEKCSDRTLAMLARRRDVDTLRCILDNWGSTEDGVRLAIESALIVSCSVTLGWLHRNYPIEFDTEIVAEWLRQHPDNVLEDWLRGLQRTETSGA